MEYLSKTYRLDEEVVSAIQKLPMSLNQFLRKALTADGVFDVGQSKPKKASRKEQVAAELAASDLTAQIVERDDIEYGHHDALPRGEHVANSSWRHNVKPLLKPSERKK